MNSDRETHVSDDQDLTRLFHAQQDTVPEALDKLILEASRDAVSEPVLNNRKRRTTAIKGWFAVAATLLLGITITPLLLQAPESALEGTATSDSTQKAVQESLSMSTKPSVRDMLDSEPVAESFTVQEEAPLALGSPMMPAIQSQSLTAQSRSAMTTGNTLKQDSKVTDFEAYRRSPQSWVEQIRTLMRDKLPDEARTEYDLFRKAFPDYAPEFTLDIPSD